MLGFILFYFFCELGWWGFGWWDLMDGVRVEMKLKNNLLNRSVREGRHGKWLISVLFFLFFVLFSFSEKKRKKKRFFSEKKSAVSSAFFIFRAIFGIF